MDRLARDDAGRLDLDTLPRHVGDDALAIDGVAQAVHDAAEHALTHGDVNNGTRALDGVTLLDQPIVAEDDNTDVVVLEVERHAAEAGVELNHLAGLHLLQPVHTATAHRSRVRASVAWLAAQKLRAHLGAH